MKVLDSIPLIKKSEHLSEEKRAELDEMERELDDLIYEESVGRRQSWEQGSMLGSPNVFRP